MHGVLPEKQAWFGVNKADLIVDHPNIIERDYMELDFEWEVGAWLSNWYWIIRTKLWYSYWSSNIEQSAEETLACIYLEGSGEGQKKSLQLFFWKEKECKGSDTLVNIARNSVKLHVKEPRYIQVSLNMFLCKWCFPGNWAKQVVLRSKILFNNTVG